MHPKFKALVFSILIPLINSVYAAAPADTSAGAGSTGYQDNAIVLTNQRPVFKFSGFGSLGVSHSSMKYGDYILDSTVHEGAGLSEDWSSGNDTRLGLQLMGDFSPNVSGVVQLISEYQADDSYYPTIEWANLKYAFTRDVYIRAGRIALPTFLNSDHRKVGYSYPWIHPPLELYKQLQNTNSDGIDGMYRFEIGDAVNSVRFVAFGRSKIDRPTSRSISRDMWGLFDTIENGPLTLHAGYQERYSANKTLATGITGTYSRNSDLSVGASYDPGSWFVMSEWIQRKSSYKSSARYVSAGYRIDKFTPYVTYSQNSPGSLYSSDGPPSSTNIRLAARSQSTVSIGTRWDFMRHTDFKVQYDQVRLSDESNGYLGNVPSGVTLYGQKFHVISAVLDFIF